MKTFSRLCTLLAILCLLPLSAALAADDVTVTAMPASIAMDAFYNGATLDVSGQIPDGSDVVLRLVGKTGKLHLREKGKAFGLLWMNIGTLDFDNVPSVFLVASSKPLADLGEAGKTLGIDGLSQSIVQGEAAADPELDAVHELLRLKSTTGLYAESATPVALSDETGGRVFMTKIQVPSVLTPGEYHLEAIALRDGAVVGQTTVPVKATLVGAPAWLSHMAFDNGLMYGILATIIAILSGLAIGLVFQSKGAH